MNPSDKITTSVLVVEDEAIVQLHLRRMLSALGYDVVGGAASVQDALKLAEQTRPDLVLMDIELQGEGDGVEAARRLRQMHDPAIVFLTAYADAATVRRTEEVGAVGYIVKPYSRNEVRAVLTTALGIRQRMRQLTGTTGNPAAGAPVRVRANFHGMLGESPVMQALFDRITDVARLDWAVLIEGETGTGKEMTASALHAESARADGPLIPVNCAGLTDSLLTSQLFGHKRGAFTGAISDQRGFFEAANGGTLFLDEIADTSAAIQRALLRVLEDGVVQRVGDTGPRRVDVRVLSATQRDLVAEVAAGRFRADLLYRLRAVRLSLPPLRERIQDIGLLAEGFLARAAHHTGLPVTGLDTGARECLAAYHWPGNVRELRHAVDHAVLACRKGQLSARHLPPEIFSGEPAQAGDDSHDERQRICDALLATKGNRAEAARLLGISRATLYRRFASLNIAPDGGTADKGR